MRILVAGFPHSGTSILRKVIGNHPDVLDYYWTETMSLGRRRGIRLLDRFRRTTYDGKPHVVFKFPHYQVESATNADRIIYIVKNPYDVFSSLCMRFGTDLPERHTPGDWRAYARFLLDHPPSKSHYKVRYEDLFHDNYRSLKELFSWLGLGWQDDVVKTEARYAPIRYTGQMADCEPRRMDHAAFRAWQTTQGFRNMTGQNRKHLDPGIRDSLAGLPESALLGYDPPCKRARASTRSSSIEGSVPVGVA